MTEEKEILARIGRGESMAHFETVRVRKDGKHIHVSITLSPIVDDGGKVIGASKIARDITGRKRAEEALKHERNLLRTLIDHIPDCIYVRDLANRFIEANVSLARLMGVAKPSDLIGRRDADFYPPEVAADYDKVDQGVFAGQPVINRERALRFPNGQELVFLNTKVPFKNDKGEVVGLIGIGHDITESKRAEEALNYERNLMRTMLDNSPDFIYFKDIQSRFIKAGKALASQIGVKSPDELVGKTDFDLFDEAHARPAFEDEQEIIRTGRPMIAKEEQEVWKDGHVTWASSTKLPMRDAAGKITGIMGVSRDITEKRRLEEQLRQAQKMEAVGQLAGGVAHDFNNILAVIQMQAGLMKSNTNLLPEQRQSADEICTAVERAAALVRQLLLFGRKSTLQPRDLDFNDGINNLARMLRRVLGENIELQFRFSPRSLFIHADPVLLDQVLMNLAVNSRDAMPKGGRLIIETAAVTFDEQAVSQTPQARPGSFVCLSVSDTGSGIAPENLPRIFEPFFTTKGLGKGTGLGLAVIHGIVHQHNGWINVYSEIGRGTTFRVYLPCLAKTSVAAPEPSGMTNMPRGSETILLVEDDASLRAVMHKTLAQLGYCVLEAVDGAAALKIWKWKHDEIQLLLTDLMMPGGVNGKELGKKLLKDHPKLKVIYTSGYSADVAGTDLPLEEGVNFLIKPVQAHKLAQTIRTRLDR